MKSRSKNSRRFCPAGPRVVFDAIEMLEPRRLLSVATLSNDPTHAPIDGSLRLSVDSYGAFGEDLPQSGALYDPFGPKDEQNSVAASALYFQPIGGYLGESDILGSSGLPGVNYTQQSVNSATSTFQLFDSQGGEFDVTLTQTVDPIPTSDGTTDFIQTYQITNKSSTMYNDVPFEVVRYFQSLMPWEGPTVENDWAGLSGDNRIAIAFDDLNSDTVFERIDVSGLNASDTQVADWELPTGITPDGATTNNDGTLAETIYQNQGIPASLNGKVQGDTNGDLLDDTSPQNGTATYAILALSDKLTIPMGQTVTYITTTGWGDTGSEAPVTYRKPGTFNIVAVTPSAPEGTNAEVQIVRTDGSLGHASVDFNDDDWVGTAYPGPEGDPDADFLEIDNTDSPNPIILRDGETQTGTGSETPDVEIPIFNDTKIEGSEFFVATIEVPTYGAVLANGDTLLYPGGTTTTPPTNVNITIPANDQPSPFHFATIDPTTNQAVTTSWTEGQSATIAVERNADDGGNPNTGPYGNFSVQYTITASGSNPATPGTDFVDNTPGSTFDPTTDTYTGTLSFTAATADMIDQNQYQYIDLQTLTDNLYEGPETFTIALESSDQLLITTPSTFIGTIEDAQTSGPVHLQFASESVAENAGSKTIGVLRSLVAGADNGQVTIDYSVTGGSDPTDAQPGVDFTVPGATLNGDTYSGSLTFADGASIPSVPLLIDLIATNLAEPAKTLNISLSDPNNIVGLLGTPINETLTITNNNTPGEIYFLGGATQSINEGPDPITGAPYKIMTFQVTRDPNDGSEGAVSVNYATADGTAVAGTDYQGVSGTLTWADGQTGPQDIQVEVYDDTTDPFPRTNKTFSVNLSDPTGGVALATPSSVVVTIVDDQQPGVNLSDSSYTAYEKDPSTGQPGTANIVVERDLAVGQSAAAWSFTYSIIPGTAVAGVDYVAPTSTTVNVTDPTQNTYTISIPILADDNSTSDTNFTVRLTGATIGGSSALGSSTAATVTITNADADVALSASSYSAAPGSGTLPITIDRTGRSDAAIIVGYTTVDGTAIAGTDYTATSGSVTIPAGQNSVTVNVPILTAAGASLPTRSFQFKITSAVLADPTDFGNSITVNYSATPSTVSIAGEVTATNIQLETGKGNRVNRVVVTFSDPLSTSGVNNPYNYVLTTIGKKGAFNSQIALTNAAYDSATESVTLYTKTTLSPNKLYQLSIRSDGGIVSTSNQPFVTGTPGGLGGTQVATFATGSKVKYTDPDGDIVTLQVQRGGSMQFIDGVNSSYPNVTVFGTTKTILTGTLKADGDGHTIIESVTNPDGVQDLLLDNPLFSVE
jgi:hypothetical protein